MKVSHPLRRRLSAALVSVAGLLASALCHASCGSATCPIDPQSLNLPAEGHFSFDLSFQYIDQDELRRGRREVSRSSVSSQPREVELRTVNRITTFSANYAASRDWIVSAALPYVSRFHEHLDGGDVQRWRLDGFGDLSLSARYRMAGNFWGSTAVKLPSGNRSRTNAGGIEAEPAISPGSGSTDVSLGLLYLSSALVPSLTQSFMGNVASMPYFAGATVRGNGRGTAKYRAGDELQINAGVNYPLLEKLQVLLQANARFRGKDDVGQTDAERNHTGGSVVYVSPGLRAVLSFEMAFYGYIQIPVYQRLNGLNVTSRLNFFGGFQLRLAGL